MVNVVKREKTFYVFILKSMKKRENLFMHSSSGVFLSFWILYFLGVWMVLVVVVVEVVVVIVEEEVKWCFSQGNTSMMS